VGFSEAAEKVLAAAIIVVTLMFGFLMVFASGSAIAPFIYNLVLISQDATEGTGPTAWRKEPDENGCS
jgi:hypothetical protein